MTKKGRGKEKRGDQQEEKREKKDWKIPLGGENRGSNGLWIISGGGIQEKLYVFLPAHKGEKGGGKKGRKRVLPQPERVKRTIFLTRKREKGGK